LTSPEPDSFSKSLNLLFRDLHTRWLQRAPEHMVITDERLREELALPRMTATRICYFSLPAELISLYRDSVFPLAEQAGLVPATGDETLGTGGAVHAMIEILLERAALVVADVSTGDRRVRRELRAARRGRRPRGRVAEITEEPTTDEEPSQSSDYRIVRQPLVSAGAPNPPQPSDPANWLVLLRAWLESQGAQVTAAVEGEARRLLQQGSHRHALVAAVSALEVTLQNVLKQVLATAGTVPASWTAESRLAVLLDAARQRRTLPESDLAQLREAQAARTALAHRPDAIDDARAKALAEATLAAVDRLKQPGAPP
jgi:hypothetical protein